MKAISFNKEKHLNILCNWCSARNLEMLPKTRISDYGIVIVNSDNKEICSMFLYPFMGSEWCMIENLISNPDCSKEERSEAISLCFTELFNLAKKLGYKDIFTTSYLPTVSNKLVQMGMTKNSINVNHYFGRLV